MFSTPKELEKKLNEYFEKTPFERYTISGMCLFIGCHKDTFYEYCKRDGYKEICDHARLMIENSYEMDFRLKGRASDIFAMKNFGWKDKIENDTHIEFESDGFIEAMKTDSAKTFTTEEGESIVET